jgi:MFS family permease
MKFSKESRETIMQRSGIRTFFIIWFGQFVSRIGTALTRFSLLIWAYQQTESAMAVALLGFFAFLPAIIVSPFAGVWVDRMDRRKVMLLADAGAGVMTMGMLVLYSTGNLQLWHLYLAELVAGAFESFQTPAYSAATTLLMPKQHYARANGLRAMAENGARVLSPFLAGLLLVWLGLAGVMAIDVATFLVAMVTLLIVRIPRASAPRASAEIDPAALQTRFWHELQVGFSYIWRRPGLLGLTLTFTGMNFFASLTYFSTMPAMILARSGGSELALASLQGALGAAGVVGALVVSLWGGPRRKIHGVLMAAALSYLCGDLIIATGRTIPVWVIGGFISYFFVPFIGSSNDAIWQAKVDPALQGRVFATKSMVGQLLMPVGYLVSGILADQWLEPAMMPGGALADQFAWLVGTGPGAGIALMFTVVSILGGAICLAGYLFPAVRNVEEDLDDHDVAAARAAVQSA